MFASPASNIWVRYVAAGRWALTMMITLGSGACLVELNPLFHGEESEGSEGSESAGDGDLGGGEVSNACLADESLVACYRFEDPHEIVDGTTYANHGSATVLGLGAGRSGMGLDCETSEAAQIPDSASLDVSEAMTMAMWVRPDVFPGSGRAMWFDNSGQYAILFDAAAGYQCRVRTSDGSFQVEVAAGWVPLGTWTHIACTYDGTASRLYANAEQVASVDMTGVVYASNDEPATLGSNSPTFDERCSGQIDDVYIFSRALTAQELAMLAGPL